MTNNDFHKLGIKTGKNEIFNSVENSHYIREFCINNGLVKRDEKEFNFAKILLIRAIKYIFKPLLHQEAMINGDEDMAKWLQGFYFEIDYKHTEIRWALITLKPPVWDKYQIDLLYPLINLMRETEGKKVKQGDKLVKKLYEYFKNEIEKRRQYA